MTHHDRLSNPLFSGEIELFTDLKANTNTVENAQESENNRKPEGDPGEVLIRTRHGRVV